VSPVPTSAEAPRVTPPDTGNPAELPARPPARVSPLPHPAADTGTAQQNVPRGNYVHDGVFARLSVGPGWFQASSGRSPDTRNFDGGTVSIDGAVGGAPVRGFIIGAEFQTNRVFALSSSDGVIDGDEPDLSDTRFSVTSIAVFADYYPVPTDGLHFLAAIGAGWLDVAHSHSSGSPSPTGPLLSAGGGYEWFVGPNVSLGLLLRANLGVFTVNETGSGSTHVTAFVPALLGTVTYN